MKSKNDYTPVSSFYYVTHSIVIGKEIAKCIEVKELSRSVLLCLALSRSVKHVIFPIMELQAHVTNTKNIIAEQWELITERIANAMLCNGFMIFRQKKKRIRTKQKMRREKEDGKIKILRKRKLEYFPRLPSPCQYTLICRPNFT